MYLKEKQCDQNNKISSFYFRYNFLLTRMGQNIKKKMSYIANKEERFKFTKLVLVYL